MFKWNKRQLSVRHPVSYSIMIFFTFFTFFPRVCSRIGSMTILKAETCGGWYATWRVKSSSWLVSQIEIKDSWWLCEKAESADVIMNTTCRFCLAFLRQIISFISSYGAGASIKHIIKLSIRRHIFVINFRWKAYDINKLLYITSSNVRVL